MKYQKNKKSRTKKVVIITLSVILVLGLAAVLTVYIYINSLVGKVKYKSLSNNTTSSSTVDPSKDTKDVKGNPLMSDRDVLNVLLVGLDNRADTVEGGRSDSMIILSINQKTKRIIMTSIMRDTYLQIPDHGSNRLNAAYAFGGMNLLISTIQRNFDIKIDKYATVDFAKFMDIIDKLGGVNIDVDDNEIPVLNSYLQEINVLTKTPEGTDYLTSGGKNLKLTGRQALAYSRIRYVGNGDFGRTQRQRIVLDAVFSKMKTQNILQLTSILNMLMPDITTDLTQDELKGIVYNSLTYKGYETVQNRIPIDGSYKDVTINSMAVLQVDFDKNIQSIKSVIYGTGTSPNKSSK